MGSKRWDGQDIIGINLGHRCFFLAAWLMKLEGYPIQQHVNDNKGHAKPASVFFPKRTILMGMGWMSI